MHVLTRRRFYSRIGQHLLKYNALKHGNGKPAPCVAVFASELFHERGGTKAADLPDAICRRTEAEQVLRAIHFDSIPGFARAALAHADLVKFEMRSKNRTRVLGPH